MKCLIVTAHPLEKSLCNAFGAHIHKQLVTGGHDVVVENLYEMDFSPVLTVVERETYYNLPYDSSAVDLHVQHLLEAEALVLVFPTWWFGFPAILKGWFDRVWGPGIAYDHADDFGPIRPRLDRLEKVFAVTTLGAAWWVDRLVLRQPVKRVLKTALLGACAKNCSLDFFSFYSSENVHPQNVEKFLGKIDKKINNWS